jgi:hypothetical protein
VERVGAPGVLGERVFEAHEGALEIAARREQQRTTPREDRERPRPVEPLGALLPGRENLVGLVELSDGDQVSSRSPSSTRIPGSRTPIWSRTAPARLS